MRDYSQSTVTASNEAYNEGLRKYMVGVYNNMAAGLAVTGFVAYIVGTTPMLTEMLMSGIGLFVAIFSPFIVLYFMGTKMEEKSSEWLFMMFMLISATFGLSMATIFLKFTAVSITKVFFITSGMFGGTALYGYTTKRDLSGIGSFLMMGLIGLIIALVANIFIQSTMMMFIISCIGVIVFVGFIAYDTQSIKTLYNEKHSSMADDDMRKMAIMGSLNLYLDFLNLFQFLLELVGERNN